MRGVVRDLLVAAALGFAMARRMESVILSAYKIALPFKLRAARPMVWIKLRSLRKKPSLSASKIATKLTSGTSKPSRKQVDAYQHIKHAQAQITQNLNALYRVNVAV